MRIHQQEEALSRLLVAVEHGWRCAALTGPAGSGKSRLLRDLSSSVNLRNTIAIALDATGLSRAEFAARLAAEATRTYRPGANSWQHISDVLHGWQAAGTATLWIIDQVDDAAEELCGDLLRLMRLLDRARVTGTVLFAQRSHADRRWLSDAIELVVSLDHHHAAAAA